MTVYTPRGFLEAVLATLQRWALQLFIKPVFSPRWSIPFQRRWLTLMARIALPVPRSVTITPGQVGGVAGEWLRKSPQTQNEQNTHPSLGTVLYLHGGAYCIGSPATHRSLTVRLALSSGLPVFSLDYRLAPEHPYPAALHDALAAFDALRANGPVILTGDSAGGGLALATAMALRDAGKPAPAALLLRSPLGDVVRSNPPPQPVPGEAMLSVA